jgi:hypothetical protein
MDKSYQLIEGNLTTEINIKNPFDKFKEIYEFYKDFMSKLLNLKDKKIKFTRKIIDINQFDYISTFIVFGNDFEKYTSKLLFKEMEILSNIKDKKKYDICKKRLPSNLDFKSISEDVKHNFGIKGHKKCKKSLNQYSFCFICKDLLLR